MIHPVFDQKMDIGQNTDTYRMDGSLVLHINEQEPTSNPDDVLDRRLKNRERQRRYRARKRHEADLRKASVVDKSTPLLCYNQTPAKLLSVPTQVEISVNSTTPVVVHSQRDWKKDARMAHIHKKQEIRSIGLSSNPETTTTPSSAPSLDDNNVTQRLQLGKRHWKAEARNKKSSE